MYRAPSSNSNPPTLQQRYLRSRTALRFYVVSMVVLFGAFGMAVVFTRRYGTATHPGLPTIFYLNTLLILVSSYTYLRAQRSAQAANPPRVLLWLWATALLTVLFAAGQGLGFLQLAHLRHTFTGNVFTGYVYILAGTHALHLLGALIVLAVLLVRAAQARVHPAQVQLLGIFWHSLGLLWLAVLAVLWAVLG